MKWGVLQFPGSCDERDALNACLIAERSLNAGGGTTFESRLVWHEETDLTGLDGIVVPGGFSYGDYLRAGAIARFSPAMNAVVEFAADGGPVLGICNGFQVLCESGLLPGALLTNERTRFICRQGDLVVGEADSPFLAEFEPGQTISIPFKHQSGRFFAPPGMLERIEANEQVAFRYGPGQNPNGSLNDIAGIVNEAGNVLGLMPHPEHAVEAFSGSTDGLAIFRGPGLRESAGAAA